MPKKTYKIPNPLYLLKGYFLTGLLVLAPFAVIAWILGALFAAIWRLHGLLPKDWLPSGFVQDSALYMLVNVSFTVGALLAAAIGVSFLGWASKNLFGRKVLEFFGEIINHIPVIRSIYSALDQLLRTIASNNGQQFNRVVYIEYPRKNVWTLAFVTGPTRAKNLPPHHLNVYVPTTPNPTSGFYLIVAENEVKESELRVEDAFKQILSLGIAQGQG
jgi:uncharacterized membrane protein